MITQINQKDRAILEYTKITDDEFMALSREQRRNVIKQVKKEISEYKSYLRYRSELHA